MQSVISDMYFNIYYENILTKDFFRGVICFVDCHYSWLQNGQQRDVFRENTEVTAEGWYVNLLYVGLVVKDLRVEIKIIIELVQFGIIVSDPR